MPTPAQYTAAANAIKAMAEHMINSEVPFLERGIAQQALSEARLEAFAKAAVDAAEGVKV